MFGKVVLWLLAFLALISFNFGNPGGRLADRISALYRKADSLYHLNGSTAGTDSMAFAGFEQVIAAIEGRRDFVDRDRILSRSYLQKGVLLDVKNDYAGATKAYCKVFSIHGTTDSLSFVAHVYAGTAYYNLNNFDSASYLLLRAAAMTGAWHARADEVRLYNTLGVLYYDNGNYSQGKNYFNRALEIVENKKPVDTVSAVSLETNIATSFYRLGLYGESLSIYHKILSYHLGTNFIYINMGRTYAALDKYREALACFKKVNAGQAPSVLNEMAAAYLQLQRPDSCAQYLDRLVSLENKGKPNGLDIGVNESYRADLLAGRQQYEAALMSLQKAIIRFSGGNFNNPDIFSNPSGFMGSFAYYTLFDALYKKAQLLRRLYQVQAKEEYLSAAYETYKAALAMLRYIEKSYDTDDAKLFLKKKSGQVYQGALSVCLDLHRLHPGDHYLEQAFMISERNKASIITAGLRERGFANQAAGGEALMQRERNIKYNIARLNVRSDETQDSRELEVLAREKTGYEIELSHLQKDLEQNDAYYRLKYDDSSPGVQELQERLDPGQALISFYNTAEALHIFVLTRSSFGYIRVDSLSGLQQDVGDWLHMLQTAENGRKFKGRAIGNRLYRRLIRPIQELIPQQQEWIIVPDGMLYYLPFESLPAEEGSRSLLETTTISYRFSSSFLIKSPVADQKKFSSYEVLGFAPFAGQGGSFDPPGSNGQPVSTLPRLPASRGEIEGLPGSVYTDSLATKKRFLEEMNKYPVIHLATHAVSSPDNPSESFIAFYPQNRSRAEDCLFLEELYGLNMNKTKLVIISACETGQGELVSDEGVISLARAFAYAGCESTICSLWRADDKATSAILGKFHIYLQKGYSKSKALQQAKLDYLKSDALNKSPAYWAHLVLIGDDGPVCAAGFPYRWIMLVAALLAAGGLLGFWVIKKGKKKSRRFSGTMDVG
jgi:CHAT domain-containing protein